MKKKYKYFVLLFGIISMVFLVSCGKTGQSGIDGNYVSKDGEYSKAIVIKNGKGGYSTLKSNSSFPDYVKVSTNGKDKITIGEAHRDFKSLDNGSGFKLDNGSVYYKSDSEKGKELIKEDKDDDQGLKYLIGEANKARVRKITYLTTDLSQLRSDYFDVHSASYKAPKKISKMVGNYSFKNDTYNGYLKINKNGTYTLFVYTNKIKIDDPMGREDKTKYLFYIDKDNQMKELQRQTKMSSGVVAQKYGKYYLGTVDEAIQGFEPDQSGKIVNMPSKRGMQIKKDLNESIEYAGGSDGAVPLKSDKGHNIKFTSKGLKLNLKDNDTDLEEVTWVDLKKISKEPKEVKKSTYQVFNNMKKPRKYSNQNQFFQYNVKRQYAYGGISKSVDSYDLSKLQSGYTSDNKKVKIKYAFRYGNYIFATDGNKIYTYWAITDKTKKEIRQKEYVVKEW